VESGRCQAHRSEARKQQDAGRRYDHAERYGARHRAWRRAILDRDPLCRTCQRRPSVVADHVVPIEEGGARFALENGQGLCLACHNAKTARERQTRGEGGIGSLGSGAL
jgi:5-methylcytosine-specific restriction protein A